MYNIPLIKRKLKKLMIIPVFIAGLTGLPLIINHTNIQAEEITEPPLIHITKEYSDPYLYIDNYSYNNIYQIVISNNNNPSDVITYNAYDSSVNLRSSGIKYYGDFSISVNICDYYSNILATSDPITYSNHALIQEDNTANNQPSFNIEGLVSGTKYSVYRSAGNMTEFSKIADYEYHNYNYDEDDRDYTYVDEYAVPGVNYYYYVQAYETDSYGNIYTDSISNIVCKTAAPSDEIHTSMTDSGAIKISFTGSWYYNNNREYYIYKAAKGDTSFTKVKTLAASYLNEWTDTDVKLGNTYYYMVTYNLSQGIKVIPATEVLCTFASAKISHKTTTPTKMKVSWKKITKADSYMVYLRKPGKSDYKFYKKFSSGKRSFTMKVSNGKQYGIKIVACGTVNGTQLTGNESIYEPYGDYYGYANESYESKNNRVYKGFKKSSSWKVIDKRMTSISVKVWDFKSGMSGKKVTKTKYITCHKRLAPTIKKIFSEIYKGKEKAPIYEIGCYSRRSGEHGNGMAIDLNSNYNAMFDNGKPTVGSYWNPKKYAYSIKRNGDIEKAFEKYGFSRGFWGSRADYMHFSYFGG